MCCDKGTEKFFMGMAMGMAAGAMLCCCIEKCCRKPKCHHKHVKDKMVKKAENCAENIGDMFGM